MRASTGTLTGEGEQQQPRSSWPTASSGAWRPQNVAAGARLARLLRYLPLSLLVSAAVTVLPVWIAAWLIGGNGVTDLLLSAALAMAISFVLAGSLAAGWRRWSRSRELLFGDLLLWGWSRRLWAESRLLRARAQFESIAATGAQVSIALLERVTRVLQARDPLTHGHSQRVTRHAVEIARAMRLPPNQVAKIRAAAAVHDVGKIYTPQAILNNPGKLSEDEFEIVKRHAADGAGLVGPAGDREITAMVRHHHERLSGSGYPDGLVGERIPLGARIIAVADCFDAITSTRTYRNARSHKAALDVLSKEAGRGLDADVVAAFQRTYSSRRALAWTALATLATAIPERVLAWLQGTGAGLGVGSLPQMLPVLGAAGALALASPGHSARHSAPVRAQSIAPGSQLRGSSAFPPEDGTTPAADVQLPAGPQHARARSHGNEPIASIPSHPGSKRQAASGVQPIPSAGPNGGGGSGNSTGGNGSSSSGSSSNATGSNTTSPGSSSGSSSPPSTTTSPTPTPAPAPAPEGHSSGSSQTTATVSTPPVPVAVPEVSVKMPSVGAVVPSVGVSIGGGSGSTISIGVKIGG
ncbi:MAG TPA: HD-GYP domain-containing protein [Solirubrobacteraceae bacterium]|jgi:hypothetical protein|nr:HD-GYP domain-containing protein [Solirubrobacteraceae bacterium]